MAGSLGFFSLDLDRSGARLPERGRFSIGLLGLTPDGERDREVGTGGIVVEPTPHWWGVGGLWLDGRGRATVTTGYRPKGGPIGFTAIRFGGLR